MVSDLSCPLSKFSNMDKYVCTFDEATLKVAIDELNEEPEQRESQVETFRQWIRQQKHLNCPIDTGFLLRFLRTAKFSQLRARKVLEGHLTQKVLHPDWLSDIDIACPEMQRMLQAKLFLPLPGRDAKGRKIMLVNHEMDPDPKIWDRNVAFRMIFAVYYYMTMEESDLVNGTIILIDQTGFSMKWISFLGVDTLPKVLQAWQGNLTGRLKGYHYYNPGKFFEALMAIIRPVLSQKFKDRIYLHDTMEEVYKLIPKENLPREYLPDDYTGPCAGTLDEILGNFLEETKSARVRDYILNISSSKWRTHKNLKDNDIPNESFRKLNID